MRKASRPFDQVAIQEVRQYCQGQIEAFLGLRHQARTCCRRATGTGSEADATFVDHNPARHVRGGDYLDNRATHLPQLQNNGWPISLSKLKAHPDVIDDQCRASIPYGLWDRPPSGFAKEPVVHFTLIHFHEPSLRSRARRDGVERRLQRSGLRTASIRSRLARKLVKVSRSTTTSASMRPRSLASARIPRTPVTRTPMRSASRLAFRSSMRHKAESSEARQIASRSPRPSGRLVPVDSGLRTSSQRGGFAIQALTASGALGA